MLSYRNEAAFSKALTKAMRSRNWFVQRIESGTTGKGIPDLYVVTPHKKACWIELKREKGCIPQTGYVSIHWRPGQQAWLHSVTQYKQTAITLACFDNGILSIHHNTLWTRDTVPLTACNYFKDIRSMLDE